MAKGEVVLYNVRYFLVFGRLVKLKTVKQLKRFFVFEAPSLQILLIVIDFDLDHLDDVLSTLEVSLQRWHLDLMIPHDRVFLILHILNNLFKNQLASLLFLNPFLQMCVSVT